MADTSLANILTAAQNVVTAITGAARTYLEIQGVTNAAGLSGNATLVSGNPGRLARVSVIVAGNATGTIYDANVATATSRPLYTIPMTTGVYEVNIATQYGIVCAPGTGGQTVTVGYS